MKKGNNKKTNGEGKVLQAIDELGVSVDKKIDDLAVATKKGFDKVDENFEKVGKRLDRHEKAIETTLSEIRKLHEDNKQTLGVLRSFASDVSAHDHKITNLTVRTEKLEQKVR